MTAIRGYLPPAGEHALGVHSLDQFVLAVPDLAPAQRFYASFGRGGRQPADAKDHDHRWGSVVEGPRKRLHQLSFACYGDDLAKPKQLVERNGVRLLDPPATRR